MRRLAMLVLAAGLVAACSQPMKQIEALRRDRPITKIVLMPLDVELSELATSGKLESRAEWTAAAKANMEPALQRERAARGLDMVSYDDSRHMGENDEVRELMRLHGVVGQQIMIGSVIQLPTKAGVFDWTLGSGVSALARSYDADYAVFIHVRDSYASAGRVATIAVAALLGAHIPGGVQVGFASLVDLKTGEIVWFNRLQRATGDLRTAKPAAESVKALMNGFPK